MPYNTRRVSLSLPSLGIHLPGTHGSSRASHSNHNSAKSPTATSAIASSATATAASKPNSSLDSPPATKKVKRSHTLNSIESSTASSAATSAKSPGSPPSRSRKPSSVSAQLKTQHQHQLQQQRLALLGTPPPSPRTYESDAKLDLQGINDDIVVAVLQQLESTGNRPHLIKEFAAVLVTTLASVESSQNPVAIISSRLTNYLKRPWTALAPCPLTKEQVTVHPRRVYYYLTTMPRQEIPEYALAPHAARHVISPSISSGPDEEDEMQFRMTNERSPSPEVSFSSHEEAGDDFDHIRALNTMTFEDDSYPDLEHLSHQSGRLASPPLEHDEREFTQTASVMQLRKQSEQEENEQKRILQQSQRQTPSTDDPQSSQDGSSASSPADSNIDQDQPNNTTVEEDLSEDTDLPTHNSHYDQNHEHDPSSSFLFGQSHNTFVGHSYLDSPVMRAQPNPTMGLSINTTSLSTPKKPLSVTETAASGTYEFNVNPSAMYDTFGAWGEVKSPENVELAELDDMFGNF